ncbi:MAG: 16S rRNA (cytosine(1402)-N(4))-methyltransferase RsmH [Cyclobacteriaceae bacterium]|nr:16S rRNA (cytosine(1402)-N(4))-methyltransferase RsmH [Cyclobacteriaceae bacterium]
MNSVRLYHRPVLLAESIEAMAIREDGVYVDLTFGGGGHSIAILGNLSSGKLFAFDQDPDAETNAERLISKSFQFVSANFRYFKKYLKMYGVSEVDGILADLGVSSHQIDEPERGFSTRHDAKLDMRMDKSSALTARKILKKYSEADLHRIFGMYGEIRNAKTLAAAIVDERIKAPIKTVNELKGILEKLAPRGSEFKYYAQVFQALRIEVNQELEALKEMLESSAEILKPGGRIAVISYHSLEDRLVKNFFARGKFNGDVEKDLYGNEIKPLKSVFRKPVFPTEEEIQKNNRARSARLRVAEKL